MEQWVKPTTCAVLAMIPTTRTNSVTSASKCTSTLTQRSQMVKNGQVAISATSGTTLIAKLKQLSSIIQTLQIVSKMNPMRTTACSVQPRKVHLRKGRSRPDPRII